VPAHTPEELRSRSLPHLQEGGTSVSQEKACKILDDGSVNDQPLSDAQKRFFGLICGGGQPTRAADGAIIPDGALNLALTEILLDDPDFLDALRE